MSDREELVAKLMNMRDSLDRHAQHIHADICREAIAALSAHPVTGQGDGWISVADRLPTEHHMVLIARDDNPGWVPPMIAFHQGGKWYEDVTKPELSATHWREIPGLPAAPMTAASVTDGSK